MVQALQGSVTSDPRDRFARPRDQAADPRDRFSDRVEDYARYRPRYPRALVSVLREEIGLAPEWRVADVGSGTGISAEPFLANGNAVFGIEPNAAMRAAAESLLADRSGFISVSGSAERTTLAARSVDLVLAAQAFHWFDVEAARSEFDRILEPQGWVSLVWNTRRLASTGFLKDYEELLRRFGTDYQSVRHDTRRDALLNDFFQRGFRRRLLDNHQDLDRRGFEGRVLSSSYTPAANDPRRPAMLEQLGQIFDQHQTDGAVRFEYDTEIYFGRLGG